MRIITCLIFLTILFVAVRPPISHADEIDFGNAPTFSDSEKQWLESHPVITVALDGYFPPYSFLNDHGDLEGVSVDVVRIIEKKLGIKFSIYPQYTWDSLFEAAKVKQVDLVATMVERPERLQWFTFSEPYIKKSLVIITEGENQSVTQAKDLDNKTVALVNSYQYVQDILYKHPEMTPYYVDTMLDGLRAVSTGKADAAIAFLGAGHYLRNKYLLTNLKYAAVYDKDSAAESFAVRADWPELKTIINKALKSIPEKTMHKLRARWLPDDYQELLIDIDLTEDEMRWIEQHPEIRLGIDPEFAPFEFMEDGSYSGMTSDYVRLLNQRLNLNMTIVEGLSWKQATEGARSGGIDVLPAVGKTEAREKYLNYTKPYLEFHRVIIARDDAPFILSLSDIEDLRVGVQANSSHHGYLLENSSIVPHAYPTLEALLMALSGGAIDALVGNVASATYWIRKLNLTNLKVVAPVSREVQSLHFAVRKDWPELVPILQKGLDSISHKTHKDISEKWLHIEYQGGIDHSLLTKLLVGFSLLLSTILIWNVTLNRKVKRRTSELMRYAYYDPITRLPNRFLIQERLSQFIRQAEESNEKIAMLSIDLDDFKKINDIFGHKAGDRVLDQISVILSQALGANSILGRLGGDQFLAIITALQDDSTAAIIAQGLHQALQHPIDINAQVVTLSASIGIAIYPNDGDSPEELLKNADSATHHAKDKSYGSYAFFTTELHNNVSRKLKLEGLMRQALKRNEFYVLYQPKISTKTQKIRGFEALLRWSNEELGEISPTEFIPIAEANGLINPIGCFVFQTAIKFLAQLHREFDPAYSMAVNLSPRQFYATNLISRIQQTLHSEGMSPEHLELEITEGVLLSGSPDTDKVMAELHKLGVNLAMDDFGTGYSSLSYLRQYRFNVLKIDREFINDLATKKPDRQLVSATIAMSHNLDMEVVAEGVETLDQYNILNEYGCDIIQGWLFFKPQTDSQILTILRGEAQTLNTLLSGQQH